MAGLADLLKMFTGGAPEGGAPPAGATTTSATAADATAAADKEAYDARTQDHIRQYWLAGAGTPEGGLPDTIGGFRADPKGRFGGKDGLETQPTNLPGPELYGKIKAMRLGEAYGVPQLTPEQLAALALKEGNGPSGVFGVDPVFNTPDESGFALHPYDSNMPGDKELFDKLMEHGIADNAAAFAVRLANKQRQADRLGIPFETAWQGTGSTIYERKGAYAKNMKQFYSAAKAERNRPLVDFIRAAYGEPPPDAAPAKASGGVVIDDGNPAKRRKLI